MGSEGLGTRRRVCKEEGCWGGLCGLQASPRCSTIASNRQPPGPTLHLSSLASQLVQRL